MYRYLCATVLEELSLRIIWPVCIKLIINCHSCCILLALPRSLNLQLSPLFLLRVKATNVQGFIWRSSASTHLKGCVQLIFGLICLDYFAFLSNLLPEIS